MCVALVAGCASNGSGISSKATDVAGSLPMSESVVSITTFAKDAERGYLEAIQDGAQFEARGGCLYVGDFQTVWFFGSTVRRKPGSVEFEVVDSIGRKLAETGTTVRWGGGEVSATEAATYTFEEKLAIGEECLKRADSYWLVGEIERPLFDSNN